MARGIDRPAGPAAPHETQDLIRALEGLAVETGSLACLGCGREASCSVHGCAILRSAARALADEAAVRESFRREIQFLLDFIAGRGLSPALLAAWGNREQPDPAGRAWRDHIRVRFEGVR